MVSFSEFSYPFTFTQNNNFVKLTLNLPEEIASIQDLDEDFFDVDINEDNIVVKVNESEDEVIYNVCSNR